MTVVRGRARAGARAVLRTVFSGALIIVGLVASGCGSDNVVYGTVATTLTSVSGSFSTYTVNLSLLELTRTDGQLAYIEGGYARSERADLARLNDVSELLSTGAVPIGTYTSATITVDYSSTIVDVDINGVPTPAELVDATGTALSTQTVTVTFDPNHPLVVQTGASTRLNINFDLPAGSVIDTSTNPIQVRTQPVVVVSTTPVDSVPIRARGLFVTTAGTSGQITFNILPFYESNQYIGQTVPLGALHVQTSALTNYNVNGKPYVGSPGVTALQALPVNTLVAAYGTLGDLSGSTPSFIPTDIYAGSSLQDLAQDHFTGTIVKRTGNTLTMHGVSVLLRNGAYTYVPDLPVAVSTATIVSQDTQPNATGLDINSLSVGQHIDISGNVLCVNPSEVTPACTTIASLDATSNQARMAPTRLWGAPTSTSAGSATLNLLSLDGFPPSVFDFAGTGTSGNDANPASYLVSTGSLTQNDPLGAYDGFVTPFGSAPPDFSALAATPGSSFEDSQLIVLWPAGGITTSPISGSDANNLVVDLSGATSGTVYTGPSPLDLKAGGATPGAVTVALDPSVTAEIAVGDVTNGILVYGSLASLESEIGTLLGKAYAIQSLVAVGQYDVSGTFVAKRIHVLAYISTD